MPMGNRKRKRGLKFNHKMIRLFDSPTVSSSTVRGKGSEHLTSWLFVTEPHAGMWTLMATRYVNATSPTA